MITFGLVTGPALAETDRLLAWLKENAGLEVERRAADSYEALAGDVREGKVDVAWLPPIVFVRLGDAVTSIASIVRGGKSSYEAALIVPAASRIKSIEGLRGARAGWVDRWSASGFVLPRMKLALLGVDPRTVFRTETFYGSHKKTIEAMVEGRCDVAGTHDGAWNDVDGADVRVLATFGAIPPDVLAVRSSIDEATRAGILEGLKKDGAKPMLRAIFGGDEVRDGLAEGYDGLKSALESASARGLFD